jgi:glutaconyl-CoA/methylmalonyl-CoA decarboxylase subunit gamma
MNKFSVKVNNQTFQVEIENINSRPVIAKVDGESFEVNILADEAAPAINTAQAASKATTQSAGANSITAPIPGVIISIKANVGDKVNPGDELCVLEAMKMNNAIRTTKAGTITAVLIAQGDHVQHGQVLFELG